MGHGTIKTNLDRKLTKIDFSVVMIVSAPEETSIFANLRREISGSGFIHHINGHWMGRESIG